MQAQTERMKGELLWELHAKATTTTIKDISPNGVKADVNYQGEVSGKLSGRGVNTVSVLWKPDGTSEFEIKGLITTKDGDAVVTWGSGKGRATGPSAASVEMELKYQTQSPRLNWLNNTTAWAEGTVNRATGEAQAKFYAKK